jgi:hypothetical protein
MQIERTEQLKQIEAFLLKKDASSNTAPVTVPASNIVTDLFQPEEINELHTLTRLPITKRRELVRKKLRAFSEMLEAVHDKWDGFLRQHDTPDDEIEHEDEYDDEELTFMRPPSKECEDVYLQIVALMNAYFTAEEIRTNKSIRRAFKTIVDHCEAIFVNTTWVARDRNDSRYDDILFRMWGTQKSLKAS